MRPAHAAIILHLIVLSVLPGLVGAQEAPITKPVASVVGVFVKAEDLGDSKADRDLQGAFAKRVPEQTHVTMLDFRSALSPGAKSVLKDKQIKDLLAFPELVPATERVRHNLRADGFLIVRIEASGRVGKSSYVGTHMVYYDLRTVPSTRVDLDTIDFRSELEKGAFWDAAAGEMIGRMQRTVPGMASQNPTVGQELQVVCNKQSKLFHRTDSHHLPVPTVPIEQLDRSQAVSAGYKPCPICFSEMRKRINPESTEALLGAEVAGFIEYYYRVSNNPELHARLEKVGRKVLDANHFTKRDYVFTALNSDEINAFAAPGGYIYATSGMLEAVESDDELACVLAHEIAHVEQEHGVRQYRRAQRAATLGAIVSIFSGVDLSMLADFVRELVLRGYDRGYEKEADRYGYMYVRRTPFNPEADFTLLGKLQDMELTNNINIVSWLRTHPKADDRVKYVNEYKADSEKASKYLSELESVDKGLASAIRADQLKYVDSIDQLKAFVDASKLLP